MARLQSDETRKELRNEDPLSGEAGAHPVGTGVGAALGGAAAGALAGAVGGPVGAAVGAAVGAVAGGMGGKAVAEEINPTTELDYWRDNYTHRDYYDPNLPYSEYESAYRFALENYRDNYLLDDPVHESNVRNRWEASNPNSRLSWDNAKRAMTDAWHRVVGDDRTDTCCTTDRSCRTN